MPAMMAFQSEVERYFSERAARTTPAHAKALLERIGTKGQIRDDDRLDVPEN
ncbi:hypothetical protein [Komagataeibacter nataicola]|uniref:hypothetical protein n=1 Tax=Komagataeibacter nataicola TaxID=265960 RepID=UPI001F40E57A|nr:hypothetical protein [Komagataeibacter nataicola]WNM10239.1 hypothetical protein RI056_18210 [Komagataeibacter nataicola]